jgi:hypothetical protein
MALHAWLHWRWTGGGGGATRCASLGGCEQAAKGQGGGKRGATENQLSLSMALVRFGGSEVRSLRQVLVFGSEQLENRATVVALDRLRGERAYVWGKPEAVIPSIFFSFRRSIFFIEKLLPIFSTTAHTHHQRTERNRFFF